MDAYFSMSYALRPITLAVLGVSCFVALLSFILYMRRSSSSTAKNVNEFGEMRSHRVASTGGGGGGGAGGADSGNNARQSQYVSPRNSRLENSDDLAVALLRSGNPSTSPRNTASESTPANRVPPKKPRREVSSAVFEDWGRSVTAYGLDLGSYSIKGHAFRDGKMTELNSKRSVVCVVDEGIVLGDVEVALDNPGTSFFSLTRDLAAPDSVVVVNDVVVHPYQALAGAMMFILQLERATDMPPIGVCVPPYLQHVAQFLYLAAVAANAQRMLIYSHSAACIASLLRQRQQNTKRQNHKPPRNVVFVDFGRSGVVAYICEVRDSAGSVLFQTFRSANIQNMESRLVLELSSGLDEQDESLMARIIEAAKDIKEDFASVPEYLAATKKSSSVHLIGSDVMVEMSRERFDEICQIALQDVEEVCGDLVQWITQNIPNTPWEDIELNLIGQGFRSKLFRSVFESKFDRRHTAVDKVSISMGLAQLTLMEHPLFQGQRFDIYPLFQLPTVDELGVRKNEEITAKRFSIMSPRAAQRNSSQLARDRTRSESSLAATQTSGGGGSGGLQAQQYGAM